jgi:PRC-barrel domain protein
MRVLSRQDIHENWGKDVLDPDDESVGAFEAIYVDSESKEPRFVAVRTGLFGTGHTVIPVKKEDVIQGIVRVGYDKEAVKEAPDVELADELGPEAEKRITEYYGGHHRRDPEPLPPPGDILKQREATRDLEGDVEIEEAQEPQRG